VAVVDDRFAAGANAMPRYSPGRRAGWLRLHAVLAGQADRTDRDLSDLASDLRMLDQLRRLLSC
jgi:hypothetical protein